MTSDTTIEATQSPDPVTTDMVVVDPKYPPGYSPINFASGGDTLHGSVYVAQGPGPNPCLLMVPEVGGYDRMASLIFPVLNAGISVCYFYPRGMWTGPSAYSILSAVDDVKTAVAYLKTKHCVDAFRLDADRIALCGYSGGGASVSLVAAGEDPSINHVAAILPFNFDRLARGEEISAAAHQQETADASTGRQSLEGLGTMSAAEFDRISIVKHAKDLAAKTLLVISATADAFNPVESSHKPIVDALNAAGAQHLTEVLLDSDHLLLTKRIELAHLLVGWLKNNCLF